VLSVLTCTHGAALLNAILHPMEMATTHVDGFRSSPVMQILENAQVTRSLCGLPGTNPSSSASSASALSTREDYAVLETDDDDDNDTASDADDEGCGPPESSSSSPPPQRQRRAAMAADSAGVLWKKNGFRGFCVLFTTGIAIGVPKFGLVSNAVGAFSCTFMAFLLPTTFHLVIFPVNTALAVTQSVSMPR
jgi:hypothetical protein